MDIHVMSTWDGPALRTGAIAQRTQRPTATLFATLMAAAGLLESGAQILPFVRRLRRRRARTPAPAAASDDRVPETIDRVVVDHPDGLHERITDGRPDEFETAPRKIAAQRVRLRRGGRDLSGCSPAIHPRRPI